jgi:FkbM family methyltransferase
MHLDSRFETNYASGAYEPLIEAVLLSGLEAGGVFYDVGAHIGLFSLLAARVVGKSGSVFAFEADPENAERIKEHASRNGLDYIHVVPCAVWSSPGRLAFERASADSSRNQGAVANDFSKANKNTIEVEAVSLDAFAQKHKPPTLIKIDVEGGEAAVLDGSKETFKSNAPLLICEVHNQRAADYVTRWLGSNSYVFDWIEESADFPRHLLAKRDR